MMRFVLALIFLLSSYGSAQAASWSIIKSKDAFTGTETVVAQVSGDDGGGFLVRCFEGKLQFFLEIPHQLRIKHYQFMGQSTLEIPGYRFRVDHLPIVGPDSPIGGILKYHGERYEETQDIPTLFNRISGKEIVQKLVSGKRLIYQIPPENGPVYKISLAGSSKYLLPIIRECERESSELSPQVLVGSERSIKKKPTASRPQRGAQNSIAIQLYKVELESKIKNNWSYPAAFMDPNKQKNLEALVLITVKRDGTIVNSRLEKPSGNARFDESVQRAIDRSNPLPPFPPGFLKTYEEIEINFNLRELEQNP